MHRYPLVIFDLDGTLIDSFPGIRLGLNSALAEHGLPPVGEDWVCRHVGWGARHLIQAASGDRIATDRLLATFNRRYPEVMLHNSPPFSGVDDALKILAKDHTLAIASNKPLLWACDLIAHHGWSPLMAVIAGPESAGAHKPDPAMIEFILSKTRRTLADAIVVGDMPVDVETAANAGIPVVGVTTGSCERDVLTAAGCSIVLDSVADLVSQGVPVSLESARTTSG